MDEPISKVLKQLQSQINTHEIRVSALRQKQRSITGQITLYSVLVYLAYLIYYALGRNYELDGQTILEWAAKIAVMPLFPALYVSSRWVLKLIGKGIWTQEKCKMVVYPSNRSGNSGKGGVEDEIAGEN